MKRIGDSWPCPEIRSSSLCLSLRLFISLLNDTIVAVYGVRSVASIGQFVQNTILTLTGPRGAEYICRVAVPMPRLVPSTLMEEDV